VSCTDIAIATEDSRFIAPGPRVGMTSVGGLSQWLPLHMSHKKSAEIVLTSSELEAEEALEHGAVNELVPSDELDEKVREYLDEMKQLSPSALSYFKVHHNWWKEIVWRQTWEQAKAWFSLNMGSMEPTEGLGAFQDRRTPEMQAIRDEMAGGRDPRVPFGPYGTECPECGSEYLPDDSAFCLECGADLEE
jgi:enoyl-CoA hydratase/carnithine racemase